MASGLTVGELGLGRDRVRAGIGLGLAAGAPVVAAFGVGAVVPATRPLLDDQRVAGLDRRQLAYQVLVRIPVGTGLLRGGGPGSWRSPVWWPGPLRRAAGRQSH